MMQAPQHGHDPLAGPACETPVAVLTSAPFLGDLASAGRPTGEDVNLYWLGQAGFLVRSSQVSFAIDPYLSNSLEKKYRGTATPHMRMMPVPVLPRALDKLDYVFCTHGHTDHMDPETLLGILSASGEAMVVAPRAARDHLHKIGIPGNRLRLVNAGERIDLSPGITLMVTASAHESFKRDENGDYPFLGYAIQLGDVTVFHSGDCIPFEGLENNVSQLGADIALLPVNGRRAELTDRGIAGNFFPVEAADLCAAARIPNLIIHHFGMFSFNSADPQKARLEIASAHPRLNVLSAELGTEFKITKHRSHWRKA